MRAADDVLRAALDKTVRNIVADEASGTWVELPVSASERGNTEVLRAALKGWEPGDGLLCSHSAKQRTEPCGTPVAVLEVEQIKAWRDQTPTKRRSILCSRHVAGAVRRLLGEAGPTGTASLRGDVDRRVREAILVRHWDEYQTLLSEELRSAEDAYLGLLPASLREYFRTVESDNS